MISLDTLDDVKRDFAKWRASRPNKTSKIPKRLWDKVFAMLEYHSVAEVTKELGVSTSQISAQRKQRNTPDPNSKSPLADNFLELNLSPSIPSNKSTGNTCGRIEIRRPDGSALTIGHLSEQMILQILTQFTQMVQ